MISRESLLVIEAEITDELLLGLDSKSNANHTLNLIIGGLFYMVCEKFKDFNTNGTDVDQMS
jgi:hypothetical protein